MISGLVAFPRICTTDDIARVPSVSRVHFIGCPANTAAEGRGNSLPTAQYAHGLLSCSELTVVVVLGTARRNPDGRT